MQENLLLNTFLFVCTKNAFSDRHLFKISPNRISRSGIILRITARKILITYINGENVKLSKIGFVHFFNIFYNRTTLKYKNGS